MSYLAPLTSDKTNKTNKLINKEATDISVEKIIDNKGSYLGSVNLNNMIPTSEGNIEEIKFKDITDIKYASLLNKQLRVLNKEDNRDKIRRKAEKLHTILTTENSAKQNFEKHCLNLNALEVECKKINNI